MPRSDPHVSADRPPEGEEGSRGPARPLSVWIRVRIFFLVALALGAVASLPGARLWAVRYELTPPRLPDNGGERDTALFVRAVDEQGAPVRAAEVRVLVSLNDRVYLASTGTTADDGAVHLTGLPRGEAWILADATGKARASRSLVLVPGEREIVLTFVAEHFFDVEVRSAGGEAVAGAEIEVATGEPLPIGARADSRGRAHVGRLPKAPWVLRVRAPGYDEVVDRSVHDGGSVLITLHRLGSIVVTVLDGGGLPVPDANVQIAGTALWPPRQGKTGEHGKVKLAGLFAGTYALRAQRGADVSDTEIGLALTAGQDLEVTLLLVPGRSVAVHVVDGEADLASPVRGARVVLAESGVSPFPLEAVTDAKGRATLGPIAAGAATLTARAEGYVGRSAVAVPEVLAGEVKLVLLRAGVLRGVVVDARGFPIAGATVAIVGNDFDGGPIDDDPRKREFREAQFTAALAGPASLVPAGELGVVPGPVPPIPRLGSPLLLPNTPHAVPPEEPWVTRADGTFRAAPVTPGRVRALVRHPEYVEAYSDAVTLTAGGDAEVRVVLHRGGTVEGRVLDATGRAVAGARVELAATRGTLERSLRTAADGSFAFAAVPDQIALNVFASDDDLQPSVRAHLDVPEGERKEITLTLPVSRESTTVRVDDDRGYPVATAQVSAISLDPGAPVRVTAFTDAQGEGTLVGVRGLRLRLEVFAPTHAPRSVTVDAAPPNVHVALDRAMAVHGLVRELRTGAPLGDADVALTTELGLRRVHTEPDGSFRATELSTGQLRVRIRSAGHAPTERTLTLERGTKDELELAPFELSVEATVDGLVVDGRGDPVAGARVSKDQVPVYLAATKAPPGVAITDGKGHFHLGELPDGILVLEAYGPDVGRARAEVRVSAGGRPADVRMILGASSEGGSTPHAAGSVAVTLGEVSAAREVVIVAVADGSEAERAGVLAGDVLLRVDDVPVHGIEEARARLSGPLGDDVVLELRRAAGVRSLRVAREPVRR